MNIHQSIILMSSIAAPALCGQAPRLSIAVPGATTVLADVNGDGVREFVVAPGTLGAYAVVYSGRTGVKVGTATGDGLATECRRIVDLGDLTGDGKPEFAVSNVPTANSNGRVHVFSGALSASGTFPLLVTLSRVAQPNTVAVGAGLPHAGSATEDLFGYGMDVVGDWTGDGKPELAIGIPGLQPIPGGGAGSPFAGAVIVVSLNAPSFAAALSAAVVAPGGFGTQLGTSVRAISDRDGDGRPEIAAGAPAVNNGLLATSVWIIPSGGGANFAIPSPVGMGDEFGMQVEDFGDATGDGVSDIAIAATKVGAERVYVFSGATLTLASAPYVGTGRGSIGWALASVGDWDLDGRADFLTTEPQPQGSTGFPTAGPVAVVGIGPFGPTTLATLLPGADRTQFGESVTVITSGSSRIIAVLDPHPHLGSFLRVFAR